MRVTFRECAWHAAHVGHRERVQVVHQAVELQHFVTQAGQHLWGWRACAIFNGFQLSAQYGERCAQLVRDLGDPAATGCFQAR
jgi:hypothetical protein